MGLLVYLGLRRPHRWEPHTLLDHLSSPLRLLTLVWHLYLTLRGPPRLGPASSSSSATPLVRIVCLSDTHDAVLDRVPPGDVLIHAGDLTSKGSAAAIQTQLDWLKRLPHPVKIVVAGNHDNFFDEEARLSEDMRSRASLDLKGLVYLQDELMPLNVKGRQLNVFGAPGIPLIPGSDVDDMAFQYTNATQPWLSRVPPQTDILITHTPPKHHRDLDIGCPHLLRELWWVRPRLHVFGHVHCGYGTEPVYFDDLQRSYETLLDHPPRGLLGDLLPNAYWLELLCFFLQAVQSLLWQRLMVGPSANTGGLMVNAAQMYKNMGKVFSRAVVVDL